MSENNNAPSAEDPANPIEGAPTVRSRVAFERLRERTDELELIISGISLVALVSLPGWLFEQWVRLDVHIDGSRGVFFAFGFPIAVGLCYTLAGAFLVHLVARAYWVGLIGLKSVFPQGIRWDRVTSQGPVMRERLRGRFADLDPFIDASDRFASTVFAVVSLVTLSFVWVVVPTALFLLLLDFIVRATAIPESVAVGAFVTLFFVIASISVPLYLLDRYVGWQRARGRRTSPRTVVAVHAMSRIQGWFSPQRMLLPVQLIFESNLPKHTFSIAFGTIVACTTMIGVAKLTTATEFTVFGEYPFASSDDMAGGIRTAHYEDMRASSDALLRVPMIPSDRVADPYLRVFLPYVPARDNRVLKQRCAARDADHRECVAGLWSATLDGQPVNLGDFEFAERRDLGMRGLQGYLPTAALAPGRHVLVIHWKSGGVSESKRRPSEIYHHIPFWFAPPYQLDYPPAPAQPVADPSAAAVEAP